MREIPRHPVWVVWFMMAGVACHAESGGAEPCTTDVDCSGNQVCRIDPPTQAMQALGAAQAFPTFPMQPNPCLALRTCSQSSQCTPAEVCGPNPTPAPCTQLVCRESCKTAGCSADEVCETSGLCGFRHCRQAGAPACTDPFRCDAAAAMTAPAPVVAGSLTAAPVDLARAAMRGCVPKKCSEPGGLACRENWRCDPAVATDPSGCVPLPCTQTGKCENEQVYICNPGNAGPRPGGTDVHGCVQRNCAERAVDLCIYAMNGVDHSDCDVTSPVADTYGCVLRRCNENPAACTESQRCELAAPNANPLGCRPASCAGEGTVCAPPSVCDPGASRSDVYGCRQPEVTAVTGGRPGAGGAIGAGGAGGSGGRVSWGGGAQTGGAGGVTAGAGGAAGAMGVCVD